MNVRMRFRVNESGLSAYVNENEERLSQSQANADLHKPIHYKD